MAFYHTRSFLTHHRIGGRHIISSYITILTFMVLMTGLYDSVRAQSQISFSAGTGMPVGNFASQSYPEGGFALPGGYFSVEGAWFFNNRMGIGAEAGFFANPVETGSLAEGKMDDDPFLLDLTVRSDPYQVAYASPAFFYTIPLSEKFTVPLKAKFGVAYAISPYQLNKPEYYLIGNQWFEITSAKDWLWTAGIEGGVSWLLSPCLALSATTGISYFPIEWRFRRGDGTFRYQAHDALLIHLDLGLTLFIGSEKEQ